MNDLKISEASKNIRDLVLSKSWWDSQERTELLENKIQKAINSELDRIAGPLVEALAHMGVTEESLQNTSFESMIDGTDCSNFLYNALANYRKERGE